MKRANWIVLISTLLMGTMAQAADQGGLFLEPGLTYQVISSSDLTYPSNGSGQGNVKGLGLMARFGMHVYETIFLAADGRFGRLTVKDNNNGYDSTGSAYNYGLTVGAQMPIVGVRAWAGWIIGGSVDPDASNGFDAKYSGGSGWRLGAGFHITAVSVNLEYQQLTFSTVEIQQLGPFAPGTSFAGAQLADKSWVLSVSFPIQL